MSTFFSFLKKNTFPNKETFKTVFARPLSWYALLLSVLIGGALVVVYSLLSTMSNRFTVTVPARGGTLVEGVIGGPHFINPVLASTETDAGLSSLVFSGLMKTLPDGTIVPDLARSYTVSPDGKTYTFTLANKTAFSDGKALTSADIAFSITKYQAFSPHEAAYWQNITVATPDLRTVVFTLPAPDTAFLVHTTIGILPEHIWKDIPDGAFQTTTLNTHPIGSGPFAYKTLTLKGTVPQEIRLVRNKKYSGQKPYLNELDVAFFSNQDDLAGALKAGTIDTTVALLPAYAHLFTPTDFITTQIATPSTIALYRTVNESQFTDSAFVTALDQYIDRTVILATVEDGYGISRAMLPSAGLKQTIDTLKRLGYSYQNGIAQKNKVPVAFAIAVENTPSSILTARTLATELGQLGLTVSVKVFDSGTFADGVQAGTYPIILASSTDIHSDTYHRIFDLYTETMPSISHRGLHATTQPYLSTPTDRYRDVALWYSHTDNVWKWFVRKKH